MPTGYSFKNSLELGFKKDFVMYAYRVRIIKKRIQKNPLKETKILQVIITLL
jgi:hypothetical protein